jgi:hypothetical protein
MSDRHDDANAFLKQVMEIAIGASYVLMEYYSTRPTEWQLLKMRCALAVKRACQRRADVWQDRALDAATYYQRQRSIT